MSRCEFYVNNSYEMCEKAVLFDDNGIELKLHHKIHSSLLQDSVLIVDKSERKEIWLRYFPEDQIGNESRLTVYGHEVDELVIINHTGELLVINNKTEILPGESSILYKK